MQPANNNNSNSDSGNNTNKNELVKAQQFICIKCIFLYGRRAVIGGCVQPIPKALKFVFN